MDTISYGGYHARVEYDLRDNIFVGRVLAVPEIVSFHAALDKCSA